MWLKCSIVVLFCFHHKIFAGLIIKVIVAITPGNILVYQYKVCPAHLDLFNVNDNENFLYFALIIHLNTREQLHSFPCDEDKDCQLELGPSAICNDANCECVDCENMSIVLTLGEKCRYQMQCNIPASSCIENKCACNSTHVPSRNNNKCLPVAQHLNEPCEINQQCVANIQFSICFKNTCLCQLRYHAVNGACWEKIGLTETCKFHEECLIINNTICNENKQCVCAKDFISSTNKKTCLKIAENENATCVENIQCLHLMGEFSHCKNSHCKCKESYHFTSNPSRCVLDKGLSDICGLNEDCHQIGQEEQRMLCVEGQCVCKEPFQEMQGLCIDAGSNLTPIIIYLLLTIGLLITFL